MSLPDPFLTKDGAGASKSFNVRDKEGSKTTRIDPSISAPDSRLLTISHQKLGKAGTPAERNEHRASLAYIRKDTTTGLIYTAYVNLVVGIPVSGPITLSDLRTMSFLIGHPSAANAFDAGLLETSAWDAFLRGEG